MIQRELYPVLLTRCYADTERIIGNWLESIEKQEKRSYLLPKLQVRVITLLTSERQGLRETPLRMLLMKP